MDKDIKIGDRTTYQGYSIKKVADGEYRVEIYSNDLTTAKEVIKRCLEAGVIEWPVETAGRRKRQPLKGGNYEMGGLSS
jgi:hypothetical protein